MRVGNTRIMLKRIAAILILFLPLLTSAQNRSLLPQLLLTSQEANVTVASARLEGFEQGLRKKTSTSDFAFLKTIFTKTQKNFLKHYSQYPELSEIFSTGNYDCLTATSLFSILLSDFHFQHRIVETNYHIFLMVQTTKGEVLIETTDRYNGFVTDLKEIEKRLGSYKQNIIAPASNKNYYAFHFSLYQNVSPHQLAGLLYYNRAVKSFNKKEYIQSAELLDKAKAIYESPRVAELAVILIEAAMESDLSESNKLMIFERYKIYWQQRSHLMAVR